jgi:RHS repeat-associated protein
MCESFTTGLYYYRARYYDSTRSRFVSEDPIGLDGYDVDPYVDKTGRFSRVDLYPYARNSPTRFSDPFGLQAVAIPGFPLAPPLPPVMIPGSPENRALVESTSQALRDLARLLQRDSSKPDPERCRKAKEQCIEECLDELGKGGRCNQGIPFRNCIRRCMKAAGCEGYSDYW